MKTDSLFYRLFQRCPQLAMELLGLEFSGSSYTFGSIETILVYKLPRLTREEIRAMLNVQNIELKQTQFYREIAAEEQIKGEQLLLQRLLTHRFGKLPNEIEQQLAHASAKEIEQWADRLFVAATLEAVFSEITH